MSRRSGRWAGSALVVAVATAAAVSSARKRHDREIAAEAAAVIGRDEVVTSSVAVPAPGPARSRRRDLRHALVAAAAVAMVVGGTMTTSSSFNAQTTNGASASSGSLVLSNTKIGGTGACLSSTGGIAVNTNSSCDVGISATAMKPGASASARFNLTNTGTIDASSLKLNPSACIDSDAAGESVHGAGSMCGTLQIYVQQYSDSGFTTPSKCWYGGGTSTTCAFDPAKTINAFGTAYAASTPLSIGALTASASSYYEVFVGLPSSADNTMQGRAATFGFNWTLLQ